MPIPIYVTREWWDKHRDKTPDELSNADDILTIGLVWSGRVFIKEDKPSSKKDLFNQDINASKTFQFVEKAAKDSTHAFAQMIYTIRLWYGVDGKRQNRAKAKEIFQSIPKEELDHQKNLNDVHFQLFLGQISILNLGSGRNDKKAWQCFHNILALHPQNNAALGYLGDAYNEAMFYQPEGLWVKSNEQASWYYRQAIKYGCNVSLERFERLFEASQDNPAVVYHYAMSTQDREAKKLLTHLIKNNPKPFLSFVAQYDRQAILSPREESFLFDLIHEHETFLLTMLPQTSAEYQRLCVWLGRRTESLRAQGKLGPKDASPEDYYQQVTEVEALPEDERLMVASYYYDQAVHQQCQTESHGPAVIQDRPYFSAMRYLSSVYKTSDEAAFMMMTLMAGRYDADKAMPELGCTPETCRAKIEDYDAQYEEDKAEHAVAQTQYEASQQQLVLELQHLMVDAAKNECFVFSLFYDVVNFICQVIKLTWGIALHYGETITVDG